MWSRIERASQPGAEPVTLAEAKRQINITHSDDDDLLNALIKAAREFVEGPNGACGIVIMQSSWTLKLDSFPPMIWIPTGPVQAIDSIGYVDTAGAAQTVDAADFQWRKDNLGAMVMPAYQSSWPTARAAFDSVTVTFTAGFQGTADSPVDRTWIPGQLRQALLALIGHWYANRESVGQVGDEIAQSFNAVANQFRVGRQ